MLYKVGSVGYFSFFLGEKTNFFLKLYINRQNLTCMLVSIQIVPGKQTEIKVPDPLSSVP